MKVVHIVYSLGIGGIETMLVNIVNVQVKMAEVHIIVVNDIVDSGLKELLSKEVIFHCLRRKKGSRNPIPVIGLNLLLHSLAPDVIHLHSFTLIKYIFSPRLKKKTCLTFHSTLNRNVNNGVTNYLRLFSKIFAISQSVSIDLQTNLGIDSEIIYNGINVEVIKNSHTIKNEIFRIVQVSRLEDWHKGQHVLIKAIYILVQKGYVNLHIDFIGEGSSRQYLEDLVSKLSLGNYVTFLGSKPQTYIYDKLCEYDLFVQPSIFEGFGLTVAEAMAAKVPVLVSKNQGPLEIIDNGKYGYFFEINDSEGCANAIELFLQKRNDKEMVEKAYKRVKECFNVQRTAVNYLNSYKKIAYDRNEAEKNM